MARRLTMTLRYSAEAASSRVRGVELAAALRRGGMHVAVVTPDERNWRRRYYLAAASPRALYVQKRVSTRDAKIVRARRSLGLATIYDLDDAPGGVAEDATVESLTANIMRAASAVTVGSRALRDYAARYNDNVTIVPSAVDTTLFAPAPERQAGRPVTIGWIGNGAGYGRELADLARIVDRLRDRVRVRVAIVGAMERPEIHRAFAHDDDRVVDSLEWRRTEAIVEAIRDFDVGVYPLRDTDYNSFKCGYKAIQYMAMGIPVVASPVGETRHIVAEDVTGSLPQSEDEWVDRLAGLVADEGARRRMGEAGRSVVETSYSMERAAALLRGVVDGL
jgi:glycosyltransferase involved in cell wall biosynthesis